jgi:hypothetical protein
MPTGSGDSPRGKFRRCVPDSSGMNDSAGRYCTISVKVVVRVRVPVDDAAEAETVTFDEPAGVPGSPPPLPELEPPPQLAIGIMQIAIARAANADQRPFCGVELKIIATAKASADANHNPCPRAAAVFGAVVEIVSVV